MGGRGSTRWQGHTPKALVEETPALDLLDPAIKGALDATSPTENLGVGTRLILCLSDPCATEIAVERVQIGVAARWLLVCPVCGRRVRRLFFLSAPARLMCRRCGNLEYQSVQQHDQRVDDCRRAPREFWDNRQHLRGRYSQLVSLHIFREAERRGIQWLSAEDLRRWLFEGASAEEREILERLPLCTGVRLPQPTAEAETEG